VWGAWHLISYPIRKRFVAVVCLLCASLAACVVAFRALIFEVASSHKEEIE
jgi:hypothetical protein